MLEGLENGVSFDEIIEISFLRFIDDYKEKFNNWQKFKENFMLN